MHGMALHRESHSWNPQTYHTCIWSRCDKIKDCQDMFSGSLLFNMLINWVPHSYRCSSFHAWLHIIRTITYAPAISPPGGHLSCHTCWICILSQRSILWLVSISASFVFLYRYRFYHTENTPVTPDLDLKISSKFPDLQIYWISFVLYNISSHCDGSILFFHDYHYSEVLSIFFI